MLRHLFASRADQSWERQIKKYLYPDLLIIDDFGLTALTPIQAEDIYEVITERHSAVVDRHHEQPAASGLGGSLPGPGHGQLGAGPPCSPCPSPHDR